MAGLALPDIPAGERKITFRLRRQGGPFTRLAGSEQSRGTVRPRHERNASVKIEKSTIAMIRMAFKIRHIAVR